MQCIFVGAREFFLNRLIQNTYANISVLEIGVLSIKGGTEPVVMAQSRVQQFTRLFKSNESLPSDIESDVKRQFKHFVETHADKYTVDLLLLPSALKDELLSLTLDNKCLETENYLDLVDLSIAHSSDLNEQEDTVEESRKKAGTPVTELTEQMNAVFSSEKQLCPVKGTPPKQERQSVKRRSSEGEERCSKKLFSLEAVQIDGPIFKSDAADKVAIIDLISDPSDLDESLIFIESDDTVNEETEYKILVNFFKTMGYSQNIVEKVIGDLGQSEEPLKLLEEIEKESRKVVHKRKSPVPHNHAGSLHKNGLKVHESSNETTMNHWVLGAESHPKQEVSIDLTLGASPANKTNISSNSAQKQVHDLPDGYVSHTTRLAAERTSPTGFDFVARGTSSPPRYKPVVKETLLLQHQSAGPSGAQCKSAAVQERTGPSHFSPVKSCNKALVNPMPPEEKRAPVPVERLPSYHSDVTGVQRFLHSIKVPYRLELKNEPGRIDLKHIIIDGSNVAVSHGLQKFFSCRGIALAVEYFWKKGHRTITVFVPQWRTKRDPNITEQHFLLQLQDLGILSFTPARTVLGARIASHDDRFLLHLAEKTGGIIVTNDNFREFVTESPVWREIIKERLLQFTFAGDIFMIPDDPLGRHGPKLEDFLCKQSNIRNFPPPCIRPSNNGVCFPGANLAPPGTMAPNVGLIQPRLLPLGQPLPTLRLPPQNLIRPGPAPPQRSLSETAELKDSLLKIFPEAEQRQKIIQILSAHPYMRDLNALSALVLD
ncbi:hypothetical protein FKM82_003667 [Ascaphus truei]